MQPIAEEDAPIFSFGKSPSATPGLSNEARALLRTIYGSESAYAGRDPYTVMYGGRTVSDFSDHPRQLMPIVSGPNATSRTGLRTSAAGGYQFLRGSWDEAKDALGLSDFSPGNQDRAALWHAQRTYKRGTGRDLEADIAAANGDPQKLMAIGRGLSPWWTSLPGGIEPNKATGSFAKRFQSNLDYAGSEGDADKPALYSPMAFSGDPSSASSNPIQAAARPPNRPMPLNVQNPQLIYQPTANPEDAPVNFSDDPLSWLRGRNTAKFDATKGLMAAGLALMAANNPKGAAVLAGQMPSSEDDWTPVKTDTGIAMVRKRDGMIKWNAMPQSPLVNDYEKSYDAANAKGMVDLGNSIRDNAGNAKDTLGKLDALERALANPQVYQGFGGDAMLALKKAAGALGYKTEGVSDAELANAIRNQMAIKSRQTDQLTGNTSDKDMQILLGQQAGIDKTPEGNKLIIDMHRAQAERAKQIELWRQEYVSSHNGRLDEGWYPFLERKQNEVPMFSEDFKRRANDFVAKAQQPAQATQPTTPPYLQPQGPTASSSSPTYKRWNPSTGRIE